MLCCIEWRRYALRAVTLRVLELRVADAHRLASMCIVLQKWLRSAQASRLRARSLHAHQLAARRRTSRRCFREWWVRWRASRSRRARTNAYLERMNRRKLWRLFAGWVNVVLYFADGTPRTPSRHRQWVASLPAVGNTPPPVSPLFKMWSFSKPEDRSLGLDLPTTSAALSTSMHTSLHRDKPNSDAASVVPHSKLPSAAGATMN